MVKLETFLSCITWWLSVAGHAVEFNGVLDLPQCDRSTITKDVSISPKNPSITRTSGSRSIVECVIGCMKSYPFGCTSVFRDKTSGKCYEMNGTSTEVLIPSSESTPVGHFIEFLKKGEERNCSGRECSGSEVCIEGCSGIKLDAAVCLGDQTRACDLMREYNNLRHYWSDAVGDDQNSGAVMTVTYPKKEDNSGLRVIVHLNVKAGGSQYGVCARWFVTFDGTECDDPDNIEMLDSTVNVGNMHRDLDVDGTCYGLEAGNKRIELVVEKCAGFPYSDPYTGWRTSRTMIIMEITPQTSLKERAITLCPLLNEFNYQYYTWNNESENTIHKTSGDMLVQSVSYEKMANDTNLRIKYSSVAGIRVPDDSTYYCGRWYVKVDGTDCYPQLGFFLSPQTSYADYYYSAHRRSRTAEGICDNGLETGVHSVEIWVKACGGSGFSQSTTVMTGGFDSPSRLHIEEVRREQAVDGVRSRTQMYRGHSGKLQDYHWLNLNILSSGMNEIVQITYYKEFSDTGLRLTASGSHALVRRSSGYGHCSRWYFMIDGSECSNPGRIEGVEHFNGYTIYHNPMQVSGICHGVLKGNHSIAYTVGQCSGYGSAESCTGWNSSFNIFVEELRLDLKKICTGNPVNCDA